MSPWKSGETPSADGEVEGVGKGWMKMPTGMFQVYAYQGRMDQTGKPVAEPVGPIFTHMGGAKKWMNEHWGKLWAPEVVGVMVNQCSLMN
jgi:hypothetical protein